MTVCRACAGEAVKIDGNKEVRRDHTDCVAERLSKRGSISDENAKKFCTCYGNNHEGEKSDEVSKKFMESQEIVKKRREEDKQEQQKITYDFDKKKKEEEENYLKRLDELKKLDKNGKEWILSVKYDDDGNVIEE